MSASKIFRELDTTCRYMYTNYLETAINGISGARHNNYCDAVS